MLFENNPLSAFFSLIILLGLVLGSFFSGVNYEATRQARTRSVQAAVQQPTQPPAQPELLREAEEAADVPNVPETQPLNSQDEKPRVDSEEEELSHWEVLNAAWARTRSSFRLYDHLKKSGTVSKEVFASYIHWSEVLAYQEFTFKFDLEKAETFKEFSLAKGEELWKQVTEENPTRAEFLQAGRKYGPLPWPTRIELALDRQLPPRHTLAIAYFNKAYALVKMVEDWNDPETTKTAEQKEELERLIERCRGDLTSIEAEVRRFEPGLDLET